MRYKAFSVLALCSICIFMLVRTGQAIETRPFHLGFTPWPYAATIEAVNDTNTFVTTHADIINDQIDESIPWDTALKGTAFPPGFVKKMQEKARRIGHGQKRVLYITPMNLGRNGLLPSYKDSTYQPTSDWESKRFDNLDVGKAYINYCIWMVKTFKPDYFILGIETNEYLKNTPTDWDNYHAFSKRVHKEIKRHFPTLLLSESVTLHQLMDPKQPNAESYRTKIKAFIAEQDFMAVSYYPFFMGLKSYADISRTLDAFRGYTKKPIAIAETGQPAQNLDIDVYNLHFPLTPADQNSYMKTLLEHARKDKYLFVIWWAHRDFDALWETFPAAVKDLGRCWRDIGLLDDTGKPRPAYIEWKKTLAKKYKR